MHVCVCVFVYTARIYSYACVYVTVLACAICAITHTYMHLCVFVCMVIHNLLQGCRKQFWIGQAT